ncbi:Thymidine phosphorylase-like protein [Chitinophaga pinensis DSM 2588]|uniref:Thymidine phosphorylase-like protein n=2 Tax=Chitinophaga pinensis TaxID=79329 RepID=A0A979G3J1_CHIPD|nr:Thymidine phosphorylase-like protein [Chitinophaga pinensis DSM 2588]
MRNLISYARQNELTDSEVLSLAVGLSQSGEVINILEGTSLYDIPSTGGPTSLSTLLCPLFLALTGRKVLKLGVPGRPAGGIDVLAQIEGYNIAPNTNLISRWLQNYNYVHFIVAENIASLDGKLFRFRRENDAIDIPSLAIASLLSKKIAVGLSHVGLDVRVSDFGNFGKNWNEAIRNATRFNRISALAGIYSQCFLTDGNAPQQPYIGRGESILALQKLFMGQADPWLEGHVDTCFKMSAMLTDGRMNKYSISELADYFFKNVVLQAGSKKSFDQIASLTIDGHKDTIKAAQNGVLKIDLKTVRDAIVAVQNRCSGAFPDPCGIILRKAANSYVSKNDDLCTIRCVEKYKKEFAESLKAAFYFVPQPINYKDLEIITNGKV